MYLNLNTWHRVSQWCINPPRLVSLLVPVAFWAMQLIYHFFSLLNWHKNEKWQPFTNFAFCLLVSIVASVIYVSIYTIDYYFTQLRQSLHQKRTRERRDSASFGRKEPFSGKNLILQVKLDKILEIVPRNTPTRTHTLQITPSHPTQHD